MKKKITGYQIFTVINILFMLFVIFITAYPIYYIVIASISNPVELSKQIGALWLPIKPYTTGAYKMVLHNPLIRTGALNTAFIMVVGVSLNLILTLLGGFVLSVKGPMLKDVLATMIIFTMYFNGGMVPVYLNIKDLRLLNSLWALILPSAISTSNLIIMKAGFQSIPDSLIESARLDGASYFRVLLNIMIPLCKPTIAVMVLYYGVAHWNSWFPASLYINDSTLYPLQLIARNILNSTQVLEQTGVDLDNQYVEMVKYALIVVTSVPILVLYPFLQKYFTKGVMIGAIKG